MLTREDIEDELTRATEAGLSSSHSENVILLRLIIQLLLDLRDGLPRNDD